MKFFCLCMSPAIDALVKLPSAPKGEGEIFKNVADEENVGGKTINVARWLAIRSRAGSLVPPSAHSLPGPSHTSRCRAGSLVPPSAHSLPGPSCSVVCGGMLGEDNAAPFAKELANCGIEDCFLRVPGSTRRNEMVTWPGGSFKVNRAAFPNVNVQSLKMERLLGAAVSCDVAILSGSLPKGAPPSFYADSIAWLKARGVKTVLDASGEALRLGVAAGPDVIKPNAEECEPLVGFVPKTPDEFRKTTEILKAKIGTIIISDGGAGAWFDGEFVSAPKVDVVDTTAAGDTLLAEWSWRTYGCANQSNNQTIKQSNNSNNSPARWAVAAGSAACTMPGSQPPSVETVDRLAAAI